MLTAATTTSKAAKDRDRKPASKALSKIAKATASKIVKTSIPVPLDLHIRWGVCAGLALQDRAEFARAVLEQATEWLVLSDRRKPDDKSDRRDEGPEVNSDVTIPG